MRINFVIVAMVLGISSLSAQQFDMSIDSFDFLPVDRIGLYMKGDTDTLDSYHITISQLYSRTQIHNPTDSSYSAIADPHDWTIQYGNSSIHIRGDESESCFFLKDSTTFEVVLFDELTLNVGDDFSKAEDLFPHAASRTVTDSPSGINKMMVFLFYEKPDGKYYLSDLALHIGLDIATNKITWLATNF